MCTNTYKKKVYTYTNKWINARICECIKYKHIYLSFSLYSWPRTGYWSSFFANMLELCAGQKKVSLITMLAYPPLSTVFNQKKILVIIVCISDNLSFPAVMKDLHPSSLLKASPQLFWDTADVDTSTIHILCHNIIAHLYHHLYHHCLLNHLH